MDEERVLGADWLAQLQTAASCSQRERLAVERVMLLRERRMNPWQARLVQEEEDEVQEDLRVNIQMEGEGPQELAQALVDQGP